MNDLHNFTRYEAISRLVLASSSPRRKELVASLDLSLPVSILSTDTDETIEPGWTPAEAVEQLSLRKAQAARARMEQPDQALILGADTIVVLEGAILGKPADEAEAIEMLTRLQGRRHEVFTGVSLVNAATGHATTAHRKTSVYMKPLAERRIAAYAATGEPLDKAGAYGIQGLGSTLVDRIEGCYFNVVGLPLSLLSDMLAEYDIHVF
jgi:septum formation protein